MARRARRQSPSLVRHRGPGGVVSRTVPQSPRVGLTGSLASGKSTALEVFEILGWKVLSADRMVAEIYRDYGMTKAKLTRRLEAASLAERKRKLRALERWIHPKVGRRIREGIKRAGSKPVVVEVPLLFEAKMTPFFNYTIFIECPKKKRKKRALKRGMSSELFEFLDRLQWSDERKKAAADFSVLNSTKHLLRLRIAHLARNLQTGVG